MNDKLTISLFFLVLLILAMWLHSQNKLVAVSGAIFGSDDPNSTMHLGELGLALIGYLIILSVLDARTGIILTAILVIIGFYMDDKAMGSNSVLQTLFPTAPTTTVSSSSNISPSQSLFDLGPVGGNTTRNA